MDSIPDINVFCYRFRQLATCMLLLLLSFTHSILMTEGGEFPLSAKASQEGNVKEEKVGRGQLGSRPPRCERRCRTCGHCEAIQVPVTHIIRGHGTERQFSAAAPTNAYSRGDGLSNYKPMSWKCKCGDFIFSP